MNLFDRVSVSAAHQRALIIEKQLRRLGSRLYSTGVTTNNSSGVNRTDAGVASSGVAGGSNVGRFNKPIASRPSSSGTKCFKCREPGHRQVECRKIEKKALFVNRMRRRLMMLSLRLKEMERLFLIRSM